MARGVSDYCLQLMVADLLTHSSRWEAFAVQKPAGLQVASRVRARRTALRLTQDELALELGVTHQHVSRIEGGHAVPSLDLLIRLSGRLGVSADYLLTGHETTPLDIAGAIRADQQLNPTAKRHLIGLVSELQGARPGRRSS
jgi:transcriptional regulator with XRE-family HTH domain